MAEPNDYEQDFIRILAHDLRTPISSVRSFIDLAVQAGPLEERQGYMLERAIDGLNRMEKLVNDVLEMSRLGQDAPLNTEPCSLRLLIGEGVSFLGGAAAEHNITITTNIPEDLPDVPADPNLLRQVINNLVGNAIKYNVAGGSITVTAKTTDSHVAFAITDTGKGIPAEYHQQIFEPFERGKFNNRSKIRGSGLGLSIVRTIVEKHRGTVTLESTVGKGSTFTVSLPMQP
ncbi:MAG: HAMP domain-containing sensor histidine kinase [Chloroflexota bacterium]